MTPTAGPVGGVGTIAAPADLTVRAPAAEVYELTLYVIGASALSARAITDARRFCDEYLEGRSRLTVVDLLDDTGAVRRSQVLATPTLVRSAPLPVRRLVGDLSEPDRVLAALDIPHDRPAAVRTIPAQPGPRDRYS